MILLAASLGSDLMLFLASRFVGRLGVRCATLLAGWTFCIAHLLTVRLPGLAPMMVAMVLAMLLLGPAKVCTTWRSAPLERRSNS